MNIWDKAIVLPTITSTLKNLWFDNPNSLDSFIGKKVEIFNIWDDDWQKYATIDMCCEVPIECLSIPI